MKNLRVLYINSAPQVSGAEIVLLNLIDALNNYPITPMAVCPRDGPLVKKLREKKVEVKIIHMRQLIRTSNLFRLTTYFSNFLSFSTSLRRTIKQNNIQIIHCNSFSSTLYALIAAKLSKIPLIWHMHDIVKYRLFNKIFIRVAGLGASKIICVSNAVKKNLVGFGINPRKCEVIYNYVDENKFLKGLNSGKFRREFKIKGDIHLVGIIGQIAEWKGQTIFLKAASEIIKDQPTVKFLIVGDIISEFESEYKDKVTNIIEQLNLTNNVILPGFREDIPQIMTDLNIVVHASIKPDPLPTVIIEAMTARKPIVATNVGGVPELVTNGVNGVIVQPQDPHELAKAILRLLKNPEEALMMGERGHEIAEIKFSINENVQKLLDVYQGVIPSDS